MAAVSRIFRFSSAFVPRYPARSLVGSARSWKAEPINTDKSALCIALIGRCNKKSELKKVREALDKKESELAARKEYIPPTLKLYDYYTSDGPEDRRDRDD